MYVTYILYSESIDRYYIGCTADLDRRLADHMAGKTQFTSQAKDWTVVFVQTFRTESEAMALERLIKRKKSRKSVERFILDPRNEADN